MPSCSLVLGSLYRLATFPASILLQIGRCGRVFCRQFIFYTRRPGAAEEWLSSLCSRGCEASSSGTNWQFAQEGDAQRAQTAGAAQTLDVAVPGKDPPGKMPGLCKLASASATEEGQRGNRRQNAPIVRVMLRGEVSPSK